MTNPTSNFGWQMPTNTDLVYQLPADFEVFGQAVDTSLADLKGGTSGQLLAKNSNTDMDFTWTAPATTYNPNYQLINAGGTALTGATSVTVSGISGKTNLMVVVSGGSSSSANAMIFMRLNADSGSNYAFLGMRMTPTTFFTGQTLSQTTIDLGYTGSSAADTVSAIAIIDGTNAAGFKPVTSSSVASGTNSQSMMQTAYYKGTSAITSVTIHADAGNLDAGTVFVYGA
jgi:hypothetical protein